MTRKHLLLNEPFILNFMMKQFILLLALWGMGFLGGTMSLTAQESFYDTALPLIDKKDTAALRLLLDKWQTTAPQDADRYAIQANYDLVKYILFVQQHHGKSDTPSDSIFQETRCLEQAVTTHLAEGIARFPNRLDLRYGQIHQQLIMYNYASALEAIKATIAHSATNGNSWLWTNDKARNLSDKDLALDMQDYFSRLWSAQQFDKAEEMALAFLKVYPKSVIFRSNLASIHGARGDYKGALPLVEALHHEVPNDHLIHYNLAYVYKQLGEKKKAVKCLKKLVKCNDEKMVQEAQVLLKELGEK